MKDNDSGRRASAEPALLASLPEPQSVSAHSGDGQALGALEACAAPGCPNLTDRGICDDCDDWVSLEAAKLRGRA